MLFLFCFLAGGGVLSAADSEIGAPVRVGEKAPDFELPVQGSDKYVSLSRLIEDGPVVVIVMRGYPGYQCPICSQQVGAFANRSKSLAEALGDAPNRVVLVYPGEETDSLLAQRASQFPGLRRLKDPLVMVRDPEMTLVKEWGLHWDKRRETAYPAAFVIGPGRRVKWAKISQSHGGRAGVDEILSAIKKL